MIELAPLLEHKMDYDGAWLYCATLTYNNKYDWRIPTDAEFTYNEEIDEQSFDQSDDGRYQQQLHRPIHPVRTITMIEVAPILKKHLSYDESWLYCVTLTYNSKYDWRMPTSDEYDNCDEIDQESYDESDADRHDLIYLTLRTCPVRTIDN